MNKCLIPIDLFALIAYEVDDLDDYNALRCAHSSINNVIKRSLVKQSFILCRRENGWYGRFSRCYLSKLFRSPCQLLNISHHLLGYITQIEVTEHSKSGIFGILKFVKTKIDLAHEINYVASSKYLCNSINRITFEQLMDNNAKLAIEKEIEQELCDITQILL